jgi:hypothetical protein
MASSMTYIGPGSRGGGHAEAARRPHGLDAWPLHVGVGSPVGDANVELSSRVRPSTLAPAWIHLSPRTPERRGFGGARMMGASVYKSRPSSLTLLGNTSNIRDITRRHRKAPDSKKGPAPTWTG